MIHQSKFQMVSENILKNNLAWYSNQFPAGKSQFLRKSQFQGWRTLTFPGHWAFIKASHIDKLWSVAVFLGCRGLPFYFSPRIATIYAQFPVILPQLNLSTEGNSQGKTQSVNMSCWPGCPILVWSQLRGFLWQLPAMPSWWTCKYSFL